MGISQKRCDKSADILNSFVQIYKEERVSCSYHVYQEYSYKNDCDLWLLCMAIFWHAKVGQSFSASYYHSFHGNTDGEYCISWHHLLWSPTQKEALPLFHLWLMHIYGFKQKKRERQREWVWLVTWQVTCVCCTVYATGQLVCCIVS